MGICDGPVLAGWLPPHLPVYNMVPEAYGIYCNLTGPATTFGFLAAFSLNTML